MTRYDKPFIPPKQRAELLWIGMDLDGTLAQSMWTPEDPSSNIGTPIEDNLGKLEDLVQAGKKIVIFTARPWEHYEIIEAWLNHYGIPWDKIICGKPLVAYLVDDRSIHPDASDWLAPGLPAQPSYDQEMMWAIGLFEGEGCIFKQSGRSKRYALELAMTDKDVVDRFARAVGFGKLRERPSNQDNHKDVWHWSCHRMYEVRALLDIFMPYLGERRLAKANEALEAMKDLVVTKSCGTAATYSGGCRCEECTQAWTAYQNHWKAKRLKLASSQIEHGTMTLYSYGCRCSPCKSRSASYARERRTRSKQETTGRVTV